MLCDRCQDVNREPVRLGKSTAVNSTPDSIRFEMKLTLRASLSSFAMMSVALWIAEAKAVPKKLIAADYTPGSRTLDSYFGVQKTRSAAPASSNLRPRLLCLNPLRLEAGDSRLQARVP
jgi:hypothetical protein